MRRLAPLLALAACAQGPDSDTDDSADDTDAPGAFQLDLAAERSDDPLGMFMSVWGAQADDVWVVGGQKGGAGFALRGSTGAFTPVDLPADTPMLNWVHGTAADDLWVGGVAGTLLHHDGTGWTSHDLPEVGAVWGVHAAGPDDALAVGGSFFGTGAPFAYRWDGATWAPLDLPADLPAKATLFKTHAHDGGYLVVGSSGWALRVDAGGVRKVDTGESGEDLVTVHVAPGEAPVAVGGTVAGRLWTWRDGAFVEEGAAFSRLNGVHVRPDGLVVSVGNDGIAGTWRAGDADLVEAARITRDVLHATWVAPDDTTYAVGGNFLTSKPDFHGFLGVSTP
ncbi:MAG: hypothetical protein H6732_10530 [Alphaproteobacteria bacterium]|nr:hypothetical protein [Alphaproteobacteria bacterium]